MDPIHFLGTFFYYHIYNIRYLRCFKCISPEDMAPGLFPHLAIAIDEIFHAGHLLQPHRPAGMELLGADTDFRPKTKLEAIGEAEALT